jgi:malate synthase
MTERIEVLGNAGAVQKSILTPEAGDFLAGLHRTFGPTRRELLMQREERLNALRAGAALNFAEETADVRAADWQVGTIPADLQQRWVEITGPAEPKMMINALNSGADGFMADMEDALSPTWANVIGGQAALRDAVRRQLQFTSPDGKAYRLNESIGTLLVRPRGWHLVEKHVLVDGEPISASLFDFGLYVFHNAQERLNRGTAPYFYLPKMEHYREARLWNAVFTHAQKELGIPVGTFKATVLIETLPAALQMDEILYELREHIVALNAGRWDYIFSAIKNVGGRAENVLPDRAQVTMTVPFMRAYTELLVKTCHRRGAHAMGGMAAFIPSRRDIEVNTLAFAKVREDKEREVRDGFDGTWVAHPDLVPIAREIFAEGLGNAPHQKHRLREEVAVSADELITLTVPGGTITEAGLRGNLRVALHYLNAWLSGSGAAAINNLMEDVATAEIARTQLCQWIQHGSQTDDGTVITRERCETLLVEEVAAVAAAPGQWETAAELLREMITAAELPAFLTLSAYQRLNG